MANNLLVVVNDFPDEKNIYMSNIFVKKQVEALKKYFNNIFVTIPFPSGLEYKRRREYKDYYFDNVKVSFIRYLNPIFPLTWKCFRKIWIHLEAKALLNYLVKENIEFNLIHAHYTWPSGAVALELKKYFNVPLVITEHAHISLYPFIKKKDKIISNIWNETDAIIRVNKSDIPLFSTLVPRNRIFYVPNGYNSDKINYIPRNIARKQLGLPLDVKILFNLANLYPYKGQKYLIEAIKEIVKIRKNILCIIGGSGPLKRALSNQIKASNLEEHIKLVGSIPHNEVIYWYNAADIFILPSLRESFGIVQLEAMACGKPVIATYNGGSEEIIISDKYGLLCEPADPKDLAKKILIALEREWDHEKIIKYAQQFTWENIAKNILTVYKKVEQRQYGGK